MSTQAPFREGLSGFSLLEAQDVVRLARDERRRTAYLRVLLLIEDIVSELWDLPSPSRFSTDEWERQEQELQREFGGDDSLSRNVHENLAHAKEYREESLIAREPRERALVRSETTRFMKALLFTYNEVRLLG